MHRNTDPDGVESAEVRLIEERERTLSVEDQAVLVALADADRLVDLDT
jgi:hypothetical protein